MDTEQLRLSVEMPKFPIPPSSSENVKRLSIVTPILPTTNKQWQIELGKLKGLYFSRQYKDCFSQSLRLLHDSRPTNPVHKTYILFYTALSYEMLSRTLSNLSPQRAILLKNSISYYQQALSTISSAPSPHPNPSDTSTASSASSIQTVSLESSPRTLSPSSSISSISSVSSQNSDNVSSVVDKLSPSPLRIRKTVRFASPPCSQSRLPTTISSPSPTISPMSDGCVESWLYLRALSRYQNNLSSLAAQITEHISGVQEALAKVQNEREGRKMRVGCRLMELRKLGFGEEDLKATERRERIARGRERGWVRERFEPDQVQETCRRALADL